MVTRVPPRFRSYAEARKFVFLLSEFALWFFMKARRNCLWISKHSGSLKCMQFLQCSNGSYLIERALVGYSKTNTGFFAINKVLVLYCYARIQF